MSLDHHDTEYDEKLRSYIVHRTGPWIVSVTPMLFNDRILLTHEDEYPWTWTAGWCYDKGGSAYLAARIYDPLTQTAPVGFKKIAGDNR